jgi:hypothetical protein
MSNWRKINDGWWINIDKYEQLHIEHRPGGQAKVIAVLNNEEIELEWFHTYAQAQKFLGSILGYYHDTNCTNTNSSISNKAMATATDDDKS